MHFLLDRIVPTNARPRLARCFAASKGVNKLSAIIVRPFNLKVPDAFSIRHEFTEKIFFSENIIKQSSCVSKKIFFSN